MKSSLTAARRFSALTARGRRAYSSQLRERRAGGEIDTRRRRDGGGMFRRVGLRDEWLFGLRTGDECGIVDGRDVFSWRASTGNGEGERGLHTSHDFEGELVVSLTGMRSS